ncbi:amino acid--tRNA ligase-related protein [Candidatus Vidania fulgoroideorum]
MKKIIGRITCARYFKRISFFNITSIDCGDNQIIVKGFNNISKIKKILKLGMVIKVNGLLYKTKSDPKALICKKIKVLLSNCKSFPNKYFKNVNKELSYRKRYIDLVINKKSRYTFKKRFLFLRNIRSFMYRKKFIEVETPTLCPFYGGADSKPFVTHNNYLSDKSYLRVSPEIYLKKVIVGGFNKIFEIGKNFRNEGVSKIHNPEFSMLEFYYVDKDYKDIMLFTEKLIKSVYFKTFKKKLIEYKGITINFEVPFKVMSFKDAVFNYSGYLKKKDIIKKLKTKTKIISENKDDLIYQYFDEFVAKKIKEPTFITGHPKIFSPLALKRNGKIERFELFISGMEIANGFSELNDPSEQKKRFDKQKNKYDVDYIKALEFGLPKTGGCGIGIDRLVMIFTNNSNIKDVILFPFMK